MGAATTLVSLAAGLDVRGAIVGATPTAVFGWSAQDEDQRNTAVAFLEGRQPSGAMQWWMDFLVANPFRQAPRSPRSSAAPTR